MSNIDKLIQTAENEIGYLEKASNANLDDKTANAGQNNWTKYARDLDGLGDFNNGPKNGYAWCAEFVCWCFYKTFGKDMALSMICSPKYSAAAYCPSGVNYYKSANRFYESPARGDQIFFKYGGEVGHTGIVADVKNGVVYTIEGNTSGASGVIPNGGGVCRKQYPIGYTSIYGYGRPKYELVGDNIVLPKQDEIKPTMVLYQVGSVGDKVKWIQEKLLADGCDPNGIDGEFGNDTKQAVIKFQRKHGLEADGIVGDETIKALGKIKSGNKNQQENSNIPTGLYRYGSRGNEVKWIQQKLVNAGYDPKGIDGIFGSDTRNAVIRFQTAKRLEIDGIVGKETINALRAY